MPHCLLIMAFMAAFVTNAVADTFGGRVVKVADGDTLTVLRDTEKIKVRLYGIDAPEKAQKRGTEAAALARRLADGKLVTVEVIDRDRYGRTVGLVRLPDGSLLQHRLLDAGMAWVYTAYCRKAFKADFTARQDRARRARIGLWRDADPVPPWEWRKARKAGRKTTPKGLDDWLSPLFSDAGRTTTGHAKVRGPRMCLMILN